MKKIIIPIIALVSLATLTISNNFNKKPENIKNTEVSFVSYYTLRDYNGRIALFVDDSEAPKETFNVFTDTLPEEDASKLKKGIVVKTEAELQRILEEYIS